MGTTSSQARDSCPQVFINYNRKELRNTFIKYLLYELNRKHINYFINMKMKKGKPIPYHFKKMEESAIALVIFSKQYTESRSCLDELVKVKERVEAGELMVIPVFVNLTRTEVKKFTGEFGTGFKEMIKRYAIKQENVKKWKEAVCYIADIKGSIWNDRISYGFSYPSDFTDKNLAMRAAEAVRKEVLKINPNYGKTEKNWLFECSSSFILALFFGNVIPRLVFADGKLRLVASSLVALLVFYMTYKSSHMKSPHVTTTSPPSKLD